MADSTISIGFKIDDAAGGFRKLTVDAGGWALAAVGILAVAVAWLAKRQRKR